MYGSPLDGQLTVRGCGVQGKSFNLRLSGAAWRAGPSACILEFMNTSHGMSARSSQDDGVRVTILSAGVAQIVDEGRCGYGQQGIPESGPLDVYAAQLAWALLGKVGLTRPWWMEVGLGAFTVVADRPLLLAVVGGARTVTLGDRAVAGGQATSVVRLLLPTGIRLHIGPAQTGYCSYVAFAGALLEPLVLGSASAIRNVGAPGLTGRMLAQGDEVTIAAVRACADRRPVAYAPISAWLGAHTALSDPVILRYIAGPEHDEIASACGLTGQVPLTARISSQFDRQGIRLLTELAPTFPWRGLSTSSPSAIGLIQWPVGGEPIILGPERQTVGGYPRFGTIITVDRMRLGALRPGQAVRLMPVSVQTAATLYGEWMTHMQGVQSRLRASSEAEGQHGTRR